MQADRVISTFTGQVIFCTLPNGDSVWQSGTARQRYSPTDKASYTELYSDGKWYTDTAHTELDSAIAATVAAANMPLSPVQDIN